jgi:SAM-dependent methyltransferase
MIDTHKSKYARNAARTFFDESIRTALADVPRDSRIVDLGAGNGRTVDLYHEMGFKHIEVVDRANYLDDDIAKTITLHTCDLAFEPLPFKTAGLDIVSAYQVIEHVENPWHMVREVSRCLKPGGLFLCSYPVSRDIRSRLRFLRRGDVLHFTRTNTHISFFTAAIESKLFSDFEQEAVHCLRNPILGLAKLQRILRIHMLFPARPFYSSKCLRVLRRTDT